mgnify:CR=1 FL=1
MCFGLLTEPFFYTFEAINIIINSKTFNRLLFNNGEKGV